MARKASLMMVNRKIEDGLSNLIETLTTHEYKVEIDELCNVGTELRLSFRLKKKDGTLLRRS